MNNNFTDKDSELDDYELREEYDLSQLRTVARGRYSIENRIGKNVVLLDPDVAQAFPTDEAVNEALRLVMQFARNLKELALEEV
jgi:hypothetical protein